MCIAEQTLNLRPFTPVSSDVIDLEALNRNHNLLGNRNVSLAYLLCAEECQAYAILIWDKFRRKYVPYLNNWQKWRSTANETLKEGAFV